MARSETDLFVTKILGEEKGWVSVAYKQGETVWKERQFEWPAKRDELKAWASKHAKTGDVFICPAVRIKKRRQKGDGKGLLWLWADVDMEKIPSKRHDLIKKRIAKLGTVIVSSGSGDNVHVYVRLQHEVTATEHEILNTGLRDYLGADNKQADNSLLRLPGTLNHKPANKGKAVQIKGGTRKSVDPEKLMVLPAWQNVKVEASGVASGEWTKVDITKILRGGVKAHARMRVEEAKARFGTRHKAVYAITQWLIKRGFSSDEIHSLMDEFPAAISKNEDEHGGYDVHKDIARVMTQQPTADVVKGVMADGEDEPESDDIPERVLDIMREEDYRQRAKQLRAQRTFTPPDEDSIGSLAHWFAHPPRPIPHLIKDLAGAKHNVTVTGQYKTGKTQFTMNLARCLADGVPFLDHFEVMMPDGNIGIWSLEMNDQELIDDYLRPLQIENPERIWAWHGQGQPLNILTDVGKAWAVHSLKSRATKVWIIDSLARLARRCGLSENANDDMLDLFAAIDEIKLEAGVDAVFIVTHTGRGEMQEGAERARGATAIDDWADSRWILTRDSGIRMFHVEGRGVELGQTSLHFDKETKRSSYGISGMTKAMVRTEMGIEGVVTVALKAIEASDQERVQQVVLLKLMKEAGLASQRNMLMDLLADAVETGRITESTEKSDKGRSGKFYRKPGGMTRVLPFDEMPKYRKR